MRLPRSTASRKWPSRCTRARPWSRSPRAGSISGSSSPAPRHRPPSSTPCARRTPDCTSPLSKRQRPKPAKRTRPVPDCHGRTLRQADERAERLTALSRLTRLMTSATDGTAAFRGIAEAATILLKAKMAYVWVDQGADTLREGGSFWVGPELAGRIVPVPREGSVPGSVLPSRQPEYLEDVQRDPRWRQRALAETSDLHACIALPSIHHDRAVGALIVAFGHRGSFTSEEKNLAGLLADQAAIAIENARLYEEAGQRQREAELLADVVRTVNTSLDPATVLERIAEGAQEICRSDMATIALRDPGSDAVVFRHWPGTRYEGYPSFRIAPGQGAGGQVLETGRPFRTDCYLEDPRIGPEFATAVREEGMRAYMAVPITIEGHVDGFLGVSNRDDRVLSDRNEQILLQLAAHAAVAIHNARLFADNAARRREAEALTEVGGAVAPSLDVQKILSLVVDRACALLGTQRSAVALVNADRPGTATHFVASRGMSRAFPAMRPLHPRDGTTPTAIVERRPVWSADLLNDPAFDLTASTRAAVEAEGYRAVLSVPLLVGERVLGALVTYRDDVGPFSVRQVELMQAFAHQAALALENSRLYEESERRRRESEVFAGVAQAITSSLDLDTVLRRITDSARELVGSDLAMIGFREGDSEAVTVRHRVGSRYRPDRTFVIEPGKGFGGRALLTGHPLRTDDYQNDPAVGREYLGAVVKDDSVSAMVVPIKSEARVVGLLYVANRSHRPFSDHDEATLLRLADEAAVAIRNAQLFASERESERRYRTLVESSIQGIHIHPDRITLFNNLLTVITGRTELLLLRLAADDPHRRDAELIRKTADRAASLTQQLLAFSRKQMLQPRMLDLNGVVAGMAQMLKPLVGETIELDTLLDPTLGRVKADPAQIEQIVLNLAVNARDAMPQGGQLTIQTGNVELDDAFVAAHPGAGAGPHVMLGVRDTGTGMSAEVQAHLFEPFFTTKGVGKGTGLGLATVYGIVKQHGGYIRIESGPGAGTVVRIYLARVAPVSEDAPALAADAPATVGSGTVLVVEDEGELRALAAEVLGIAGYSVLSAGSPSAALEIARRHEGPIHLLLTDVVMPEMSGLDLADRLVQSRRGLKILYMSGYTDDAIVHHGVLDPGTALLQKPFTPDRLTRRVGDLLA